MDNFYNHLTFSGHHLNKSDMDGMHQLSWLRYVNASVLIVAIICGLVGNSMVIVAFLLSKRLRKSWTNVFIVNLAVTDISTTVVMFLFAYLSVTDILKKGHIMVICAQIFVLGRAFLGCSVITLTLIAVNRWILTTKSPETYRKIYRGKFVVLMLLLSWSSSILISLALLHSGKIQFATTIRFCLYSVGESPKGFLGLIASPLVSLTTLHFIVTIIVIACCYWSTFKHIKLVRMRVQRWPEVWTITRNQNARRPHRNRIPKHEVNVTKSLFCEVVTFIIFFLPFTFIVVFQSNWLIKYQATVFVLLNSCVNPLIYGLKHPRFRQIYKCMIRGKWNLIR